MPDSQTSGIEALAAKVMDALAEVLKSSSSSETLQSQQLLLRRMALQADVFPSRIPPPKNITEVGGYLNLLGTLGQTTTRSQALSAALGVAGADPSGADQTTAVLFDVLRENDRPPGPSQPSTPVSFRVRTDFAPALVVALTKIHEAGCTLPILSAPLALPGVTSEVPVDLLPYLGRTLTLMPNAALVDPDLDALAVAHEPAVAELQVVARQLDPAAAQAATVPAKNWSAWKCDALACGEAAAQRRYLPLTPLLNEAGWYQAAIVAPQTLLQAGAWNRWTNITGLIAGSSMFGDELALRFSSETIAASSLRAATGYVWDGLRFVP